MQEIFYQKPYLTELDTTITAIIPQEKGVLVALEQTIFYPEGGGQPADQGTIGNLPVRHVVRQDGIIYHLLDEQPTKKQVHCQLDWQRRFDHMQQHGGQHILSAAAAKLFNFKTVGFHLSKSYTTIDLSTSSLSAEELKALEQEANRIVFANIPILTYVVNADQAAKIKLRKTPTVSENIRIVELKGYDAVACCGTHPQFTGEIGLIKIIRSEKIRRQVRLVFVCGNRALSNYQLKTELTNRLIEITSATENNIAATIEKLYQADKEKNKLINRLKNDILEYRAERLWQQADIKQGFRLICHCFEDLTIKELQMISHYLLKDKTIVLLACSGEKAQFLFARSEGININLGQILREVLKEYDGRGGGNDKRAQGGCKQPHVCQEVLEKAYKRIDALL